MNNKWKDTTKLTDVPLKERDAFIQEELISFFNITDKRKVSTFDLAVHLHKKYHWKKTPSVDSTKRVLNMAMEGKFQLIKYRIRG